MSPPKGGFQGGTEDPVVDVITFAGDEMGGKCHQLMHQKNIPKIQQKDSQRDPEWSQKVTQIAKRISPTNTSEKHDENTSTSLKQVTKRHDLGDFFRPKRPLNPKGSHSLKPTFGLGKT